ncbi:tetratricopeptide repeat protein [Qipengyuania sp. JC766]|uniref:tetratricopeptide repeat protein n=1 Tax=Qipengyuania sp. JC766 TaxID=3232139 RepID=UPI003457D1A2
MIRAIVATFAILAALVSAASASAQTAPVFPREDLFQAGNTAHQNGQYALASREFEAACRAGHYPACYNFALMHDAGTATGASQAMARDLYRRICDAGYSMGCYNYGAYLDQGKGGARDAATAYRVFADLAAKGHMKGAYNAGHMALNGDGTDADIFTAIRFFEIAAGKGSAEAQTAMGAIYEGGFGHFVDIPKALEWYRKAAAQGDVFASSRVTLIAQVAYERGIDAEENGDYAEAGKAFAFSCERGFQMGCYQYGIYQYYGRDGVRKDVFAAFDAFNGYCRSDPDFGCPSVMKVAWETRGSNFRDIGPLRTWLEAKCRRGRGVHCYNLSMLYENGGFGMANRAKRLEYLKAACDLNVKEGCSAHEQFTAPDFRTLQITQAPTYSSRYSMTNGSYRSPSSSGSTMANYNARQAARDFSQHLNSIRAIGSATVRTCPASNRYC